MLTISHVSKTFAPGTANEHLALDDISLHLAPGEFVTVIGSNGAGKSTLMNAVSGSFIVDKGRITLGGQDITFVKEHKRARIVGRLFQDPMKGTAPHMTLEENLALAYSRGKRRRFRRAVNAKDTAVFREALARFGMGLEDRMKTKVGLLSGGQRQAVTLLMCTIVPPRVLLLDEHTAALDPAAAEKVLAITREIVSRKADHADDHAQYPVRPFDGHAHHHDECRAHCAGYRRRRARAHDRAAPAGAVSAEKRHGPG